MSASNGVAPKAKKVEVPTIDLPTVPDMELALLGAIAVKPAVLTLDDVAAVQSSDFFDPLHRELFGLILAQLADGKPVDYISLAHAMQDVRHGDRSLYQAFGGKEDGFLYRLFKEGEVAASAPGYYADEVRQANRRRQKLLALNGALHRIAQGDDIEQAAATAVEHIQRAAAEDKPRAPLFQMFGARELLSSDFTMDWIVPSMVTQHQPHLTAGAEKTLKTTLLLYLFVCIALGESFLGRRCKRLKVLFMSSESGLATIQETVRRICESMGIDPMELEGQLFICPSTPKLGNVEHMAEVQRLLDATGAEVVGFDPLYQMLNGADATNLFEVGDRMRDATDIFLARKVTPFYCHHFRKNATDTADPALENIAYSGFSQYMRQWFLLRREREYKPGSGEHELAFVWGGSAGQSGGFDLKVSEGTCGERYFAIEQQQRSTKSDRQAQAKAKAFEQDVERARKAIDAAFRSEPGNTLTDRELKARSGKGKAYDEALARMYRAKEVEAATITKANKQTYEAIKRVWKDSPQEGA